MRFSGLPQVLLLYTSLATAIPNPLDSPLVRQLADKLTYNTFLNYVPYSDCIRLTNFLYNYDTTPLIDMWYDQVCSTGCTPNVNDYHSKARSLALPIITTEATNMGTADLTESYVTIMDRGYQWALDRCSAGALSAGNLCSDRAQLAQLADCGRENGWRFLLGNAGFLRHVVSNEACQKHLDYASDPKHLEVTVPGYLEHFKREMC